MRALLLAFLAALALARTAEAQTTAPLLTYGVTGSVSGDGFDNPTNLLARADVQRVVVDAAHGGGITSAAADAQLHGVTIAQLAAAGLLRARGDRYVIAFNLITSNDRGLIDATLAPYVASL